MEKEYKAIIFGKDIYQEIELYEESDVKIGTTQECTIRFDRTLFFDDFEINIRKNQDQWKMICGDNIYIAGEGVIKQYITNLVDGDEVFIKYQNGNTELFSITFLVDYDRQEKDYRRIIDLEQLENVSIGLDEDCDINLKSYIGKDDIPEGTYIYLVIKEHSYKIINMNLTYPVYVNGFCINKKEENLEDYDFFLYMGCNFYIKDKKLYTTSKLNVNDIKLRSTEIQMQNNRMEYPKFQRNTRIHTVIPNEKIEVQSPKEKPKKSDKNIFMSLMPALLSVILMVGLRGMMGGNSKFVIYSGAMMSMGLITSVVTFIEQSKKYKKDTKKREEVYTDYVQKREEFIKQKRKEEKEALDYTYISTTKEIEQVQNFDSRLFEKSKQDQDYLTLYIGRRKLKARCEVGYKESDFKETEDPLEEYPKLLHDSYYYLDDVPVTMDLKETNSIGIIGEKSN